VKVTVTEAQDFLRCRRKWDLTSHSRQALVTAGAPAAPLTMGSAFHAALAAQVEGRHPVEAIDEWYAEEEIRIRTEYRAAVGMDIYENELTKFRQDQEFAKILINRYYNRWTWDRPLGPAYKYIKAEIAFRIPLSGTGAEEDGETDELIGTFDGIAVHEPTGRYWGVEHKTYSMQPNLSTLATDWQMMAYAWAAEQLFGVPIEGFLYDGINKKLPQVPKVLQDGSMSCEMISTDGPTVRARIAELGHEMTPKYEEFLKKLDARDKEDQSPFFTRWKIHFTSPQISMVGDQIVQVVSDIRQAIRQDRMYPNYRWEGCWDCDVSAVCQALQRGEDVSVHLSKFVKGGGHATVRKQSLPTRAVTSLDDLLT
jgi:CRISPR/Cas system-associated exonuclease Cas4 (RecB family)